MTDAPPLDGIADAIPSLAMEPGVRVINGHQATCFSTNADHWQGDERIPYIEGGMMTWVGTWRETYIDAKLDATAHNLTHHPEEIP